jgi:hypothetical protein
METKNITRKEAAAIINDLTLHLDKWSRDTSKADRVAILSHLFDLVHGYSIPVPHPCSGEAHSNPYIDHCGVCMPNWGTVQIPVKVR